MTNAEAYDGKEGRPDLVEALFRMQEQQHPYFKRPKPDAFGNVDGNLQILAEFAQGPCIRCLRFKPGDIVQHVDTGKFGTVIGYWDSFMYNEQKEIFRKFSSGENNYCELRVEFPPDDTTYTVKVDHLKDPEIPKQMYDFVRAQLQKSCPLKEATCAS